MPNAVFSFERMDHRILAAYTLRRNPQGLLHEITFDVKHLERPLLQTLETLVHEYVHLWQQNYGENPVSHNYHNREFVNRCEAIGLHPATGYGAHTRPADGLFAEFLRAYAVPEPPPLGEPKVTPKGRPLDWWTDPEKRKRGRSSLRKWSCGCQNVRVGTKEFHAQCLLCGNEFQLVDEQQQAATGNTSTRSDTVSTVDSGWQQEELDLDYQMSHDPLEPGDDSPTVQWSAPGP